VNGLLYPDVQHSAVFNFFYSAGWVFGAAAVLLAALALAELPHFADDRPLERSSFVVSIILICASILVTSAYVWEAFDALTAHNPFERYLFIHNRMFGSYAAFYWIDIAGNLSPQLLWLKSLRSRPFARLCIAALSLLSIAIDRLPAIFYRLR